MVLSEALRFAGPRVSMASDLGLKLIAWIPSWAQLLPPSTIPPPLVRISCIQVISVRGILRGFYRDGGSTFRGDHPPEIPFLGKLNVLVHTL